VIRFVGSFTRSVSSDHLEDREGLKLLRKDWTKTFKLLLKLTLTRCFVSKKLPFLAKIQLSCANNFFWDFLMILHLKTFEMPSRCRTWALSSFYWNCFLLFAILLT
jgi:hypothetical protein